MVNQFQTQGKVFCQNIDNCCSPFYRHRSTGRRRPLDFHLFLQGTHRSAALGKFPLNKIRQQVTESELNYIQLLHTFQQIGGRSKRRPDTYNDPRSEVNQQHSGLFFAQYSYLDSLNSVFSSLKHKKQSWCSTL